jgi:hypothetical protein
LLFARPDNSAVVVINTHVGVTIGDRYAARVVVGGVFAIDR